MEESLSHDLGNQVQRKPEKRGPADGRYFESKHHNVSPQKYQYYEGKSNVIGNPFQENGRRNMNYTSLSFISNAVFYEPNRSMSLNKNDMYTTMNQLQQSKSVERLPQNLHYNYVNESKSPIRPVRSNNNNKANMTTIDTELGRTISNIYKQKLGIGEFKQTPPVYSQPNIESIGNEQKIDNKELNEKKSRIEPQKVTASNNCTRNKTLDRCVTSPNFLIQKELEHANDEDVYDEETFKKPLKMPCKQRSDCCEILFQREHPLRLKNERDESPFDKPENIECASIHSEMLQKPADREGFNNSRSSHNKGSSRNSKANSVKESNTSYDFYRKHHIDMNNQYDNQNQVNKLAIPNEDERAQASKNRQISQNKCRDYQERENYQDVARSRRDSAKQSESVMDCDCGAGYSSMWLNHYNRERKLNDERRSKIDYYQRQIFLNPELYVAKETEKSIDKNAGTSFVDRMTGCPIQKVHKEKEKNRDKLKKFLYQGKKTNGYEYNKYRLQSGERASIEFTPDYLFNKVIDPHRKSHYNIICDQIKQKNIKRQKEIEINAENELRNQKCFERKMAKLEKKQEKSKQEVKQRFKNDIDFQQKQKQKYKLSQTFR